MARQSIFDMKVSKVYPLLLQKVERKGRSKEELDTVIAWLTGYDMNRVDPEMTYGDFFRQAPAMNPRAGSRRRSPDAECAPAGQAGGRAGKGPASGKGTAMNGGKRYEYDVIHVMIDEMET